MFSNTNRYALYVECVRYLCTRKPKISLVAKVCFVQRCTVNSLVYCTYGHIRHTRTCATVSGGDIKEGLNQKARQRSSRLFELNRLFQIDRGKTASTAKILFPQTDATTFALSSNLILLLWVETNVAEPELDFDRIPLFSNINIWMPLEKQNLI